MTPQEEVKIWQRVIAIENKLTKIENDAETRNSVFVKRIDDLEKTQKAVRESLALVLSRIEKLEKHNILNLPKGFVLVSSEITDKLEKQLSLLSDKVSNIRIECVTLVAEAKKEIAEKFVKKPFSRK